MGYAEDNEKENGRMGRSIVEVVMGGHGQQVVTLDEVVQVVKLMDKDVYLAGFGWENLPRKGGGMLPLSTLAKSILQEDFFRMKEEIWQLKKAIDLLISKVNIGLGLARGIHLWI